MIFTEELFKKIKSKNPVGGSFLVGIAHHYDKCLGLVGHLNELFDSLPEDMKSNKGFQNAITSDRSDNFRGALGELVTFRLLKRYSNEILYSPKIGTLTPDFFVVTPHHSFMVESFCIGQSEEEERESRFYAEVTSQLKKYRGNRAITIEGKLVPDSNGQFIGIGEKIYEYVNLLPSEELDKRHFVRSARGASVAFTVHHYNILMPFCTGSISVGWGDPKADTILNQINKKKDKYDFPIVVSCVVDSLARASVSTLIKVLVGDPQINFKIDTNTGVMVPGSELSTYSYDGFWGIKNPNFIKNHHVQGVLYTRIRNSDEGLNFYSHMMENPYFRSGLGLIFKDIPDLAKSSHEGGIENLPGLKFS